LFNKMEIKMRSLEECRKKINEFAGKFGLVFDEEGECGFGRECVGIRDDSKWVDFNPLNHSKNYEFIQEFYDERFYEIKPENAYHKHDCLAVLGRGEGAIRELCDWVEKLEELNVVVEGKNVWE